MKIFRIYTKPNYVWVDSAVPDDLTMGQIMTSWKMDGYWINESAAVPFSIPWDG